MQSDELRLASKRVRRQLALLALIVLAMWLLELVDAVLLRQRLNALGVRPRELAGLWGILFMPLLHGGIAHLAANTIPFLVLGWLVIMRRTGDFLIVTALVMLVSGGETNATFNHITGTAWLRIGGVFSNSITN